MNFLLRISVLLLLLVLSSCQSERAQKTSYEEAPDHTNNTPQTKDYNDNRNVYFGDLHVHSSWSFDAFIYNVRTNPDDAFRFGKGEAIDHPVAGKIKNSRALDFMAVTDHAEYMGIMVQMLDEENELAQLDVAKRIKSEDRQKSIAAFGEIGISIARNQPFEQLIEKDIIYSTWQKQVEIANRHNEPGVFTSFPAYEWTSSPSIRTDPENAYAANLHRNVIYRGDKISEIPFSSFDSQDPEELWKWMAQQKSMGIDLMAIPHNGNMSDGLMYPKKTFDGRPIDKAYAQLRAEHEVINEVSQIKGTSMSHPALNPNDEFADFETYEFTFAAGTPPKGKPQGSYVREAFKNGLAFERQLGVNPYKFGLIGSSDGHNSAGPVEENNYFGKLGNIDGSPTLRLQIDGEGDVLRYSYMSAAGLAGVWAHENTRDALYDALQRKEVFATSGPRIKLRFFAVTEKLATDFTSDSGLSEAYEKGIPMGGDIYGNQGVPTFLVWAQKDPEGANLDRVQIIKQWIDKDAEVQEEIYDVAWSDNRSLNEAGVLNHIPNTVNVEEATYEKKYGAIDLYTEWSDPNFDKSLSALYFIRVLEVPTPRWSTYDAKKLGVDPPAEVPSSIQERAWSSPIWFHPN